MYRKMRNDIPQEGLYLFSLFTIGHRKIDECLMIP